MATETGFLDLMAFANGAQLAKDRLQQNDLAQLNAIGKDLGNQQAQQNFDVGQFDFGQKQFLTGLNNPIFTQQAANNLAGAQIQGDAVIGYQDSARFQADTLQQFSQVPREQQGDFLANAIQQFAANSTNPEVAKATRNFGLQQANQLRTAGRFEDAQKVINALAGVQQNTVQASQWGNRDFYTNPTNIANAGGTLLANGKVRINTTGQEVDLIPFAAQQQRLTANADAGTLSFDNAIQQQTVQQAAQQAQIDQIKSAYARLGLNVEVLPNGTILPAGQLGVSTGGGFPVVAPTYPETAGLRYPAPVATASSNDAFNSALAALGPQAAPAAPAVGLTPAFSAPAAPPAASVPAIDPAVLTQQYGFTPTPQQLQQLQQYASVGLVATPFPDGTVRVTGAAQNPGPTVAQQFRTFLGNMGSAPPVYGNTAPLGGLIQR